ncbi:MAG TPA: response regulator [Pyrinomonadaceae bacterium]|nr:response regulator [Pyrinomonadaceae bacterium]
MKPTILIVDDDEAITQQLFWTLNEDYDVVIANDMQTALRRVKIYEPAVVILDLVMPPQLDSPEAGLRILEYIKSHCPEAKVLVMTATNSIEIRKETYAAGADEFLYKPFEIEKLLTTMRRLAPRSFEFV